MQTVPIKITGNGIMSVKSEDIIKSDAGRKQLEALKKLRIGGNMGFEEWWASVGDPYNDTANSFSKLAWYQQQKTIEALELENARLLASLDDDGCNQIGL